MQKEHKKGQHKQLRLLLGTVFMLCLLDRTLTKHALREIIDDASERTRKNAAKLVDKRPAYVDHDMNGHVVYHWQRTPRYLDKNGKPFPIPAFGPAPSLEALFRQLKVRNKFKSALPHFKRFRLVRVTKGGLYYPRSGATIYPTLTPEVVEMLAQTMHRLVGTVLHNTSERRQSSIRLVERVALVPDLPRTKLPDFKRFARDQAGGMIETINEWLESRRGRSARKPHAPGRVTAGIHAFAFVEKSKR